MTALQKITLGTRGSELALTQTSMVTALLNEAHPGLEVVRNIITTSGDKRQDLRFAEFAAATGGVIDKGIFIKELEIALEDGKNRRPPCTASRTCLQTSSPTSPSPPILKRASIEDVLITAGSCASIQDLPKGARVGTSSVRRARQLKWMRPDLEIIEIRGNVPTRVKKVIGPAGEALDAVMLAAAGLERLGLMQPGSGKIEIEGNTLNSVVLDCREFLPAAGQGAIAIEVLQRNSAARDALQALNHHETRRPSAGGARVSQTSRCRLPDASRCPHLGRRRPAPHARPRLLRARRIRSPPRARSRQLHRVPPHPSH